MGVRSHAKGVRALPATCAEKFTDRPAIATEELAPISAIVIECRLELPLFPDGAAEEGSMG
jgi:hypothetical protein